MLRTECPTDGIKRLQKRLLVEVNFEILMSLFFKGDLKHRNEVKGGEKAYAVKLKLEWINLPLGGDIFRKGQLLAVKETQEEWEIVLPHNILTSLELTERVLG